MDIHQLRRDRNFWMEKASRHRQEGRDSLVLQDLEMAWALNSLIVKEQGGFEKLDPDDLMASRSLQMIGIDGIKESERKPEPFELICHIDWILARRALRMKAEPPLEILEIARDFWTFGSLLQRSGRKEESVQAYQMGLNLLEAFEEAGIRDQSSEKKLRLMKRQIELCVEVFSPSK